MTITNQEPKEIKLGNGVTTVFSFDFVVNKNADLKVIKTVGGIETILTEGSGTDNYSVSIASYPGNGSVTYPAMLGIELATGETVTLAREVIVNQETDLRNQSAWDPDQVEDALDYSRMIDLQQQEQLDRSVTGPISDNSGASWETPAPLANGIWQWAADGLSIVFSTVASLGAVVVSNILPLVSGTASAGVSEEISRVDHIHPSAKDVIETQTNKILNDLSNFIHADGVHLKARNVTGGGLIRGQAVYESAYNSGHNAIEISLANAANSAQMPSLALIDEDVLNNANTSVIKTGTITGDATYNLDTTGGGEAWVVGDYLYISAVTAGALTNVRPTGPTHQVQAIAVVLRVHATLGTLFVDGAGRANDAPNVVDAEAYIGSRVGTDIADSAAPTLPTDGNYFEALGTTTRTSYVVGPNRSWIEKTVGARTYTASSSIITEDTNDVIATAGQVLFFQSTATNVVTVTNAPGGTSRILAQPPVITTRSTTFTTSTTIPFDDTIPQNTEGGEVFTATIVPKNAANMLEITIDAWGSAATSSQTITGAIFRDATVSAIAAQGLTQLFTGNAPDGFQMRAYIVAGSVSSTEFKFHIGANSGAAYVNGNTAASKYSTASISSITIKEYLP